MNLILFGFKGCGKTHLGKRLALTLKRPFIDTDDLIVKLYTEQRGRRLKIREIHRMLGEDSFRNLETKALLSLASEADAVIALGGGAILNPGIADHLQKLGRLVYLEASFDTVRERIFRRGAPSFIDPKDPVSSLQKLYQERKKLYESIPAHRVNVDLSDEAGILQQLRAIVEAKG